MFQTEDLKESEICTRAPAPAQQRRSLDTEFVTLFLISLHNFKDLSFVNMLDPNHVAVIIHIVSFLGGVVGSFFILVANFLNWWKTRHLMDSDLLISSLALSNFVLQWMLAVSVYCYLVSGGVYSLDHISKPFFILRMVVFLNSLWCATWLSLYCCVKVVNLSLRFLDCLKTNISKMCPWLLLGSGLFSIVLSLPAIWDISREVVTNRTVGVSGNASVPDVVFLSRCSCFFTFFICGCSLAFTLFFVSTVLLITSLCIHVKRMRQNKHGFAYPRMGTHLRGIKISVSLLILYISVFVSASLIISSMVLPGEPWYVVCSVLGCGSTFLLPVVLILGNTRLTRTLTVLLLGGNCVLEEPASSTST